MKYLPLYLYIGVLLVTAVPKALAEDVASSPVSALVNTAIIKQRSVVKNLEAFGSIEPGPRNLIEIAAPRASQVQMLVPGGARVSHGEPLVSLSATPEAGVQYAQAESQAAYARSALEHTSSLFKEHLATRDQLDAARKALADAQANLAAQQKMGGKGPDVIRAPADGVVASENVASGALVAAGTTLLSFARQGEVYARLGVDPGQVGDVKAGMPLNLHEVFNPDVRYATKVSQVGGAVDPATGLVDVLARVSGKAAAEFLPGTHVSGAIKIREIRTLAVPRSAVLRDSQGAYVYIVRNHTARRVKVRTGIDDGTWIAVQGALHAGEHVVTLGNYELTDGMQVREQTP
ncbi:MAG: efflux RND transporter periplasmic adaptor subunit [Gammaproteobacteria bacterium]|nr:efflux RND transporter periplasmic adaptor subunit [Gammaproteobacteria bacterium]